MGHTTERPGSLRGQLLLITGIIGLLAMFFYAGWTFHTVPQSAGNSPATIHVQTASGTTYHYTPQTRSFVMTIVPYWVHEVTGTYDYLAPEFGKKGLLAGKEVWGFSPSTIAVYQGDTVNIDLYNPSSDPHTWSIPELGVNAPIGAPAKTTVSFVASKVGTFTFNCEVGEHFPFMSGELLVLPASAAPQS
jgi:heme/copper-type cytochrome/quinol oxidase subunit 2